MVYNVFQNFDKKTSLVHYDNRLFETFNKTQIRGIPRPAKDELDGLRLSAMSLLAKEGEGRPGDSGEGQH
jgi:hypothetical protein